MLDTACVHQHRCFCSTIESRSLNDLFRGHTADLGSKIRRVAQREFACCLPIVRARVDEDLVRKVFTNQNMKQAIRESDVSARLELQVQVALASGRCFSRVNNDPTPAVVALLPQKLIEYRKGLSAI